MPLLRKSKVNKKFVLLSPRELRKSYELLAWHYPDASCGLLHATPFELLIATILSAQCTDARVNLVTPELFKIFKDAAAFAGATLEELEEALKSINFFRNKAKNIKACCQLLVDKHQGEVPRTLEELIALPGVGRKTANVVLGNAFRQALGVVVDTHVARVSWRLGWVRERTPEKIERVLIERVPAENWIELPHLLILHGRQLCKARRPECERCFLNKLCPKNAYQPKSPVSRVLSSLRS